MKSPVWSSLALLLTVVGCGGAEERASIPGDLLASQSPGATAARGGGGGTQIPPSPTIDGPAWFLYNASAVIGTASTPDVDFGALQNTVQGGIAIGSSRTAQLLVYNISKKTPLAITDIAIVGANPDDFAVSAASLQAALAAPIPPNRGAVALLQLTFLPLAEGARTATLRIVSNAGTALVSLTGIALPARPVIVAAGSLAFLPASAPATVRVSNEGGQTLVLASIALGGSNPGSFEITVANHGFSNCFAGIPLSAHASCFLGVGLAAGALAPSEAVLAILSNDPVQPEADIQLTLSP